MKQYVLTDRDTGFQTLVRLWDETATIATRTDKWSTWSAPLVYDLASEDD